MKDQLTLGQLIEKLKACDATDPEKGVVFDFGGLAPTTAESYRGTYSQVAIGFTTKQEFPGRILKDFIEYLEKKVLDNTFDGWKGGEYEMRASTPVWAAQPGQTGDTAIVGVQDDGYIVILNTEYHG